MFETSYKVNINDINYGGHMGNERALVIFQQSRLEFFDKCGFSEISIGGGLGLIQRDAHIKFASECFWGDTLSVTVEVTSLKKSFFELFYTVKKAGKEVIAGTTTLIAYDYEKKKIAPLPNEFKIYLSEHLK